MDVNYYCPICKTKVLFTDMITQADNEPAAPTPGDPLYCPSCEMMVDPVELPATVAVHAADPENPGRSRAAGSNAGGSQRGDASDEGATQWRTDPSESERNTWKDKD